MFSLSKSIQGVENLYVSWKVSEKCFLGVSTISTYLAILIFSGLYFSPS